MSIIEKWEDIDNYEGIYQVSNLGRIRSLDMLRKTGLGVRTIKGKVLRPSVNRNGYYRIDLYKYQKRKVFVVHKLVAIAFLNHKPCGHKLVVDHINYDKLDNRVENLQIITNRENCTKDLWRQNTSSKYIGVRWHTRDNKWTAQITINNKQKHLGYFKEEYQAHLAYQKALKKLKDEHNKE